VLRPVNRRAVGMPLLDPRQSAGEVTLNTGDLVLAAPFSQVEARQMESRSP